MESQQEALKPNSSSSTTSLGKGYHNSKEVKEMILRIFEGIRADNPVWTKTQVLNKAAEYTGASTRTIERYIKEKKSGKPLESPKKNQKKHDPSTLTDYQKNLIRGIVDSFSLQKRTPTINLVYAEVANNEEIPKMSRSKLYSILKELKLK